MVSKFKNCISCAHKEYCELGAECVNNDYQYYFPYSNVRELDGTFTYPFMKGWLK
jgi:hypothetical protein